MKLSKPAMHDTRSDPDFRECKMYVPITGASKATTKRDLQDLVEEGYFPVRQRWVQHTFEQIY
jgi:hypothetical protein